MASGSYFRDLEAEYIAAALGDETSDRELAPTPEETRIETQSVWAGYVRSDDGTTLYAIGEREEVVGHAPSENEVVDALSEAFVT